jgi:hypothetical protein
MNTIETLKELLKLAHESLDSKDVEIAELEKELSSIVAGLFSENELAILKLEQQAKSLNNYADSILKRERLFHINLNERMTIHDSCRNQAEDYLNQSKALKEQDND